MRILLAPDKFKDALDAAGVCAALAAGVRAARPDAVVEECPLADGGEGTGPLLAAALGATERTARVLDPLGRECCARWWLAEARETAIVEMAEASGLWRLTPEERRAVLTTSFGTGQLLHAALDAGAVRLLLCVGGSATVDGGAGALQALGFELRDADGQALAAPLTGGALALVAQMRPPSGTSGALRSCGPAMRCPIPITVLVDVDNPLLGPRGAAPVFGPQKGATPDEVQTLAGGLENWAAVLEGATRRDVRTLKGGGAAGGIAAGLAGAMGATVVAGIDFLAEVVGLSRRLAAADMCFTGEGRLDDQTLGGKVVAGVARHAALAGTPVVAFVGASRAGVGGEEMAAKLGLRDIVVVTLAGTPLEQALRGTAVNVAAAVARYLT